MLPFIANLQTETLVRLAEAIITLAISSVLHAAHLRFDFEKVYLFLQFNIKTSLTNLSLAALPNYPRFWFPFACLSRQALKASVSRTRAWPKALVQ